MVNPTLLLCVMHLIVRHQMTDQQRGMRIVSRHILSDRFCIVVGIAIPALVAAGVVRANIAS